MITDQQKVAILESWKMVVPIAETAADLFYRRLFELEPSYRELFPEDLTEQKRKLVKMLAFIVKAWTGRTRPGKRASPKMRISSWWCSRWGGATTCSIAFRTSRTRRWEKR